MYKYSLQNSLQAAVYLPIVMSFGAAAVGLAVWRGGLLALTGQLPLGDLFVFMQYAGLFHIPIQEMAQRFTGLQAAQASGTVGVAESSCGKVARRRQSSSSRERRCK